MQKKGAVELSLNFLVIIIISIVIFGFGVYFISNLSSKANDWAKISAEELDMRISDLVCSGFDSVCIPIDKKVIQKKGYDVFGIKIFNIYIKQNFKVEVTNPKVIKSGSTDLDTPSPKLNINPPGERIILIDKNEGKSIGFLVQVPPNAASGTYILDAKITDQAGNQYGGAVFKLYVEVP